jgi:hypothetical protein
VGPWVREDIGHFKAVTEVDITTCQGQNQIPGGLKPDDIMVGRCKLTESAPMLKAPMVSALETIV